MEVGLVDRAWMEEPGQHPISTAGTLDVVERFLERSAERQPVDAGPGRAVAIQALSWRGRGAGRRVDAAR